MNYDEAKKLFYENRQVQNYFDYWEIDKAFATIETFIDNMDQVEKEVRALELIERNTCFSVDSEDEKNINISYYTNAGEDFSFNVEKGKAIIQIKNYCYNFDEEEHAKMWLNSGVSGVPSLFELVDDAKDIKEKLLNLASLLNEWGF